MQTDRLLAAYYARRAPEMELAYHRPQRAPDLARLLRLLPPLVAGRDLLEIACGTGYWTRVMARAARSIVAIDINEEMLALARGKRFPAGRVEFLRHDAWHLATLGRRCNAAAALFWWSHLPHRRIRRFLTNLHAFLPPGSPVVFVDNLPADVGRTPAVGTDADGNSYQRRELRGGDVFEIIKNYPTEAELRAALDGLATAVHYRPLECLWLLSYRTASPPPPRPIAPPRRPH